MAVRKIKKPRILKRKQFTDRGAKKIWKTAHLHG